MDRPHNEDAERAERSGATPVDSDAGADDEIGTASYAVARDGGGGGGGDDEHAATAVDGSSIDDTHEASAVGGGTIYSPASDGATEDPVDGSGLGSGTDAGRPPPGQAEPGGMLPPAPPIDGGAGDRPPSGQAADSSGTPPPPPERGYDERGQPIPNFEDGGSTESSNEGPETYSVREGVTRALDPEDYSTIRNEQQLTQEESHRRVESIDDGFSADPGLSRPPDLPESVDVTNVAPDGTSIGGSSLTSLTGEAVGGSTLSDSIQSRAGELGGDALGRGIDFDPSSPGTNDAAPGGRETTGDPTVDRAIMANDGSLMSQAKGEPRVRREPGETKIQNFDDLPAGGGKPTKEEPGVLDKLGDAWDWLTGKEEKKEPEPPKDVYTENPEGDSVDSTTNLERVRVMQGSAVNPSTNPNDGGEEGDLDPVLQAELAGGARPGSTIYGQPAQEGEVEATTLTSAAALGSSPVTNPTDPVLGDDGIIHGGSYGGGSGSGSGGGGETTPLSMTGDVSAVGATGGSVVKKEDINGASIDMVTGQVIGSSAPATGGELDSAGGLVSQGDEGDDNDGGVQSLGTGTFATAAPLSAGLAAGDMVSQGDEGDDDDAARSLGADAGLAIGADASFGAGGAPAAPGGLEGPPALGEDSPPSGEEG